MVKRGLFTLVLAATVCGCGGGGGGGYGGESDSSASDLGGSETGSADGGSTGDAASSSNVVAAVGTSRGVVEKIGPSLSRVAENARTFDYNLADIVQVSCSEGGSAAVTGTATVDFEVAVRTFSYTYQATLNECDGLTGQLSGNGSGVGRSGVVDQTATVTGTVRDQACTYNIVTLTEDVILDFNSGLSTGTISGEVIAECGMLIVSCNWQNVDINDSAALSAGCVESAA